MTCSVPTLSPSEISTLIETCLIHGGSFYRSLANALQKADPTNRMRLLTAFPEIVQLYGPDSTMYKQVAEGLRRERLQNVVESSCAMP